MAAEGEGVGDGDSTSAAKRARHAAWKRKRRAELTARDKRVDARVENSLVRSRLKEARRVSAAAAPRPSTRAHSSAAIRGEAAQREPAAFVGDRGVLNEPAVAACRRPTSCRQAGDRGVSAHCGSTAGRGEAGGRREPTIPAGRAGSSCGPSSSRRVVGCAAVTTSLPLPPPAEGELPDASTRRCKQVAREMGQHFLHLTRHRNSAFKQQALQSFMELPTLAPVRPESFVPSKDIQVATLAMSGIRTAMQTVKQVRNKDARHARSSVLNMVITPEHQQRNLQTRLGKALGLSKSSFQRQVKKRELFVPGGDVLWCGPPRKRRSDCLGPDVVDTVKKFWTELSRASSNTKDVKRQRVGPHTYIEHAVHFLDTSQTEFFLRFKEDFPNICIRQRSFEKLKPFFVKAYAERNVCCCRYHVEMVYLKDGLNVLRGLESTAHPRGRCDCTCHICRPRPTGRVDRCEAGNARFEHLRELCDAVLCPIGPRETWHALNCIEGTCEHCGISKLQLCPREHMAASSDQQVKWRRFEYQVVGKDGQGKDKKRIKLVYKNTHPSELIEYLQVRLPEFLKHNFNAKWQDAQFRKCLSDLPEGVVLSVYDFAENYGFMMQNEIQSMHWFSDQVTILVHVFYYRVGPRDPADPEAGIRKHFHFYISDDKEHDTLFVQHCAKLHWQWMKDAGIPTPRQHIVWSDGCAAQFKARRPFYFVARYPSWTGGCTMIWNFFATGHGKGEHDGAGATVKSRLRKEESLHDSIQLQKAADVVAFLRQTLSTAAATTFQSAARSVKRTFWEILPTDVDRSNKWECGEVQSELRQVHSIYGYSVEHPTKLLLRRRSCFCSNCQGSQWEKCEHLAHALRWDPHQLAPIAAGRSVVTRSHAAAEDPSAATPEHGQVQSTVIDMDAAMADSTEFDETMMGSVVAEDLEVGMDFMVRAERNNEEGVQFYLARCIIPPHILTESMENEWSGNFGPGAAVITAKYYQQWGKNQQTYVYLPKSKEALIPVESVLHININMLTSSRMVKGSPVYNLDEDTLQYLLATAAEADDY